MKCVLTICLLLMTGACNTARPIPEKANPAQQQTSGVISESHQSATTQNLEGLYFGISNEKSGQCGWLLHLNANAGTGCLYITQTGGFDLPLVQVNAVGHLTFRSGTSRKDRRYDFEGQVIPDGIQGKFQMTCFEYSADGEYFSTSDVMLRKLKTSTLKKKQVEGISGLYSNVEYNEEDGDLVGTELALVPDGEGFIGLLALDYGGYPQAVTITQSQNKIRFKVPGDGWELSFHGLLSASKIILWRDDKDVPKKQKPMMLLKKRQEDALRCIE